MAQSRFEKTNSRSPRNSGRGEDSRDPRVARKLEKQTAMLEKTRAKKQLTKQRGHARDFKSDYDEPSYSYEPPSEVVQEVVEEAVEEAVEETPEETPQSSTARLETPAPAPGPVAPAVNPWKCEPEEHADWDLLLDADVMSMPKEGDAKSPIPDEPCSTGPLDYLPAPLAEFLVPTRQQHQQERWQIVDVQAAQEVPVAV